ncbi:hypothetical protein V5O48_015391 [Marasmius crinis-equi]|uniref:Uncharacterized protein n=1 Tax=Marasmius crinis-equi TaxID=585013 RepID=A0ABR3EUL6_9AGAR
MTESPRSKSPLATTVEDVLDEQNRNSLPRKPSDPSKTPVRQPTPPPSSPETSAKTTVPETSPLSLQPPTANPELGSPPPDVIPSTSPSQPMANTSNDFTAGIASTSGETASVPGMKDPTNSEGKINEGKDEGDKADDDEGKKPGTGRARRGNPGNFMGACFQYLEESLPAYVALPSRSKEREHWLRDFIPTFKDLFPLEEYLLPEPKELAPVEELSQEVLDEMDSRDCELHVRKVKRQNATPDTYYMQSIKNWFIWRVMPYPKKDDAALRKLLKELDQDLEAPRKQSLDHFVMSHPNHKDAVQEMSDEMGAKDCLANCRVAAKKYLAELSDEEREKIENACQQEYDQAMEQWNSEMENLSEEEKTERQSQANFGGAIQPILDSIRRITGLSVVLFAGEWKGGDKFSSIQLESSEEGTRTLSSVQSKVYSAFAQTFLAWLETESSATRSKAKAGKKGSSKASEAPKKAKGTKGGKGGKGSKGGNTSESTKKKKAPSSSKKGGKGKGKGKASKKDDVEETSKDEGETPNFEGPDQEDMDVDTQENDEVNELDEEEQKEEEERKQREIKELENFRPANQTEFNRMTYHERMAYGDLQKRWAFWKSFGTTNPSLTTMIRGEDDTSISSKPKPRPKLKKKSKKSEEPAAPSRHSSRISSSSKKEPTEEDLEDEPEATSEPATKPAAKPTSETAPRTENDEGSKGGSNVQSAGVEGTAYLHPLHHPRVWELALQFAASEDAFLVLEKQLEELLGLAHSSEALQPLTTALFASENNVKEAVDQITSLRDHFLSEATSKETMTSNLKQMGDGKDNEAGVEGVGAVEVDGMDVEGNKLTPTAFASPTVPSTADISDRLGHEEANLDISDPIGVPGPSTDGNSFRIPPLQPFDKFSAASFTEDTKTHIREYMEHLLDENRGDEWKSAVFKWVELEDRWVDLNTSPQPLPTGTRPKGFRNLSKRGREKQATGLRIPEEVTYNDLRTQWWRQQDGDKIILDQNDVKGNWSNLNRLGRDGLALPLVFLWWWHDLVPATTEAKLEWLEALENVYFAYSCIYTQAATMLEEASLGKWKAVDQGLDAPASKRRGLRT